MLAKARQLLTPATPAATDTQAAALRALDKAIDAYLRVGGDIDDMIWAVEYRAECLKLARADIFNHGSTANQP